MNSRTSKIARLPLNLRDQLNHRLQSGEPGQPILDWLNQDPAVKNILTQWFHSQPINKQNLSDWRHGGYQDWLRHQARQQNIQRLAEQGGQLTKAQGTVDLCESFSQIVIAEMADELEHLHEITDRNERWKKFTGNLQRTLPSPTRLQPFPQRRPRLEQIQRPIRTPTRQPQSTPVKRGDH